MGERGLRGCSHVYVCIETKFFWRGYGFMIIGWVEGEVCVCLVVAVLQCSHAAEEGALDVCEYKAVAGVLGCAESKETGVTRAADDGGGVVGVLVVCEEEGGGGGVIIGG